MLLWLALLNFSMQLFLWCMARVFYVPEWIVNIWYFMEKLLKSFMVYVFCSQVVELFYNTSWEFFMGVFLFVNFIGFYVLCAMRKRFYVLVFTKFIWYIVSTIGMFMLHTIKHSCLNCSLKWHLHKS